MDALRERLNQPVGQLTWRLAGEHIAGERVLSRAQSGLELEVESGVWVAVPRGVWHRWVGELAVRAARDALDGPVSPQDHELQWLATALSLISALGEPDDEVEAAIAALPGGTLGLCATLNTVLLMMSLQQRSMRGVEIGRDAYFWAIRARHHSRRCEHAPYTLAMRAVRFQTERAEAHGEPGEAAAEAERAAQLEALMRLWRETL